MCVGRCGANVGVCEGGGVGGRGFFIVVEVCGTGNFEMVAMWRDWTCLLNRSRGVAVLGWVFGIVIDCLCECGACVIDNN